MTLFIFYKKHVSYTEDIFQFSHNCQQELYAEPTIMQPAVLI